MLFVWLIPALLCLLFILLSLQISSHTELKNSATTDQLAPSLNSPPPDYYAFEEFTFGKLWHFDNTHVDNQDQIPWVFVHSIGSSLYSWRYQIAEFQNKQRIIAVDLLGFGKSDKPLELPYDLDATSERLIQFLDKKQIPQCYLVGCSLGGALSLWLKAQYPQRFPRVVAIAPAATNSVVPFLRLPHDKLSLFGQKIVSRPLIKAALRGGLAYPERITPEVLENYFNPYMHPAAVTCFLKTVAVIKDPRIFAALGLLTPEILFLWGKKDRVVPFKAFERILAQVSHHHMAVHSTGGHHLMEDEPDWVNEKIHTFFTTLPKPE